MTTLSQRVVDRAAIRLSRGRPPPPAPPTPAAEPANGRPAGPTRRSFLTGTAMVGSALAVAPARFLLRPGSAYAAITDVCGPDANCAPGGFSVFCCTISGGVNQCPPGTIPGGWWRAGTGSSWCCGGDRYYIDCQASCAPGCACDSGHFCPGCQNCTAGCSNGPTCDQRNVCRIRFRYGQCNQQVACTGNILCRMVSCTPPWQIAGLNCASGPDKTDPETANHGAPCLQQPAWTTGAFPISPKIISNSPAVAQVPGSGRVDVFARLTDGRIAWSANTSGSWSPWSPLDAPPVGYFGSPAAVSGGPGNLNVFVWGGDNHLWQRYTVNYGQSWSSWVQPLGTDLQLASVPAACSWGPGRIDLFVVATDGAVYHHWFDGGWNSGWERRGSPPAAIQYQGLTAASWGPGRVDVFATAGGSLWQTFYQAGWSGWGQQPEFATRTLTSAPTAASWGVGQLAVFAQGSDAGLYWNNFFQGYWSGWQRAGAGSDTFTGNPTAGSSGCQHLNVFARGPAGRIREYLYAG